MSQTLVKPTAEPAPQASAPTQYASTGADVESHGQRPVRRLVAVALVIGVLAGLAAFGRTEPGAVALPATITSTGPQPVDVASSAVLPSNVLSLNPYTPKPSTAGPDTITSTGPQPVEVASSTGLPSNVLSLNPYTPKPSTAGPDTITSTNPHTGS